MLKDIYGNFRSKNLKNSFNKTSEVPKEPYKSPKYALESPKYQLECPKKAN